MSKGGFFMSKDCRTSFLQTVSESLIPFYPTDDVDRITHIITKALSGYSLTDTGTELVVYDDENARILKRYCACLLVDGKSKKTVEAYRVTLVKLAECLKKNYTDMDTYDLRYFLACSKDNGNSDRTLENKRANISAFFQWLVLDEVIDKNPCAKIKPIKCTEKVRTAFSQVEIDALRSACKTPKERALIEFLLSSGLRVSELCDVKVSDIDFNSLSVHVRHGKGAKERVTYIDDLTKTHLQRYLMARSEDGVFLFYNKNHDQFASGGVRFVLKTIEKRAKVTNVHPHRFRRTFATNLSKRGMGIQEIQKLLGHANINTTMEYIHTDDSVVHNSYRKYTA